MDGWMWVPSPPGLTFAKKDGHARLKKRWKGRSSSLPCASPSISVHLVTEDGPAHLDLALTARDEELTAVFWWEERPHSPGRRSRMEPANFDTVLLVGGSTRCRTFRILCGRCWARAARRVNPMSFVGGGDPGRDSRGRCARHRASGCHSADAGDRDSGRRIHFADRAEHHHSHQPQPDVHHGSGQSEHGGYPRAAGRTRVCSG